MNNLSANSQVTLIFLTFFLAAGAGVFFMRSTPRKIQQDGGIVLRVDKNTLETRLVSADEINTLRQQAPVKLFESLPYPDKIGETKTYFVHSSFRDQAETPVRVNQLLLEDLETGELLRVFSNDITLSQRALKLSRFEDGGIPGTSYEILDEVGTRALFQKLGKRYVP